MRRDHPAPAKLCSLFLFLFSLAPIGIPSAVGQDSSVEAQVRAATLPLPEGMREGARVIGWNESGERADLRAGANGMICIADEPGDGRFEVLCYAESLHPLLSRDRELRGEEHGESERERRIEEEVRTGKVVLPNQPAVLLVISGPLDSYDPATGQLAAAVDRSRMIFTPYRTAESMGLPTEREGDTPWVMASGELFSRIIIAGADGSGP